MPRNTSHSEIMIFNNNNDCSSKGRERLKNFGARGCRGSSTLLHESRNWKVELTNRFYAAGYTRQRFTFAASATILPQSCVTFRGGKPTGAGRQAATLGRRSLRLISRGSVSLHMRDRGQDFGEAKGWFTPAMRRKRFTTARHIDLSFSLIRQLPFAASATMSNKHCMSLNICASFVWYFEEEEILLAAGR